MHVWRCYLDKQMGDRTVTKARKTITTVYLEKDQQDRLQAMSDKTGVPKAVYIRKSIEAFLTGEPNAGEQELRVKVSQDDHEKLTDLADTSEFKNDQAAVLSTIIRERHLTRFGK